MEIIILHFIVLLFFPFLFTGMINRIKSIWGGRKGPSIIQPFRDFFKLLKKGEIISETTSFIFSLGPTLNLASVIFAGLIIPFVANDAVINFKGDFILFAYILGLGKAAMLLSSMDTGSSFEGMGAARENTFSALVEPAFFIILGSLCALKGYRSFEDIFHFFERSSGLFILIMSLGVIVFFIMLLVESCRLPVDDPNTHLELTMIHEVMVLDHSGVNLAFIQYSAALKMVLFGSIISNLIIPHYLNVYVYFACFIAILFAIALIIGSIESLLARFRLIHVPQIVFLMTSIGMILLSSIILFVFGGM